MSARYRVRCVAIDGEVCDEQRFSFKRTARRYAKAMRSPLYDVVLWSPGGNVTVLYPHVPPRELLDRITNNQEDA